MSKYTLVKNGDLWFAIHEDLIDENGNLTREVNAIEGLASERLQDVKDRVWRIERLEQLQAEGTELSEVELMLQVYHESLVAGK